MLAYNNPTSSVPDAHEDLPRSPLGGCLEGGLGVVEVELGADQGADVDLPAARAAIAGGKGPQREPMTRTSSMTIGARSIA